MPNCQFVEIEAYDFNEDTEKGLPTGLSMPGRTAPPSTLRKSCSSELVITLNLQFQPVWNKVLASLPKIVEATP